MVRIMLIGLLFCTVGKAMYMGGSNEEDVARFHHGLSTPDAQSTTSEATMRFLGSAKKRNLSYTLGMIKDAGLGQGNDELLHARDVNGYTILHFIAANGGKPGDQDFDYWSCKGVSHEGIELEDMTMSPTVEEVIERHDRGDYTDGSPMPLFKRSPRGHTEPRQLFGDGDEPLSPREDETVTTLQKKSDHTLMVYALAGVFCSVILKVIYDTYRAKKGTGVPAS